MLVSLLLVDVLPLITRVLLLRGVFSSQRPGRKRACHMAQVTADMIMKLIFIKFHNAKRDAEMELPGSKTQTKLHLSLGLDLIKAF